MGVSVEKVSSISKNAKSFTIKSFLPPVLLLKSLMCIYWSAFHSVLPIHMLHVAGLEVKISYFTV